MQIDIMELDQDWKEKKKSLSQFSFQALKGESSVIIKLSENSKITEEKDLKIIGEQLRAVKIKYCGISNEKVVENQNYLSKILGKLK